MGTIEYSDQENQDKQDHINRLARHLAENHVRLSIPQPFYRLAYERMLKIESESESLKPSRAIVVVTGAGASFAAAKLPLGDDTWKLLRGKLQIPSKFLDIELTRLSTQYRLETDEFETQLLALSKFSRSQLLDELENIFLRRFYTSLVYETLAHLLKHRFVDAIINFNFDELLDQAIDDEVGDENYHKIVSDGDLPGAFGTLKDKQGRFRVPLYVKPHGTASHKSSLRFTREAYFLLPENIHDLLFNLLSSTQETTLILIGFGMQSVEFTNIVQKAAQKSSLEVFIIDRSDQVQKRLPNNVKSVSHIPLPPNGNLEDLLNGLWEAVSECFNESVYPRGINRHELLSKLFSGPVQYKLQEVERTPTLTDYLKDRTIVEIMLAIAKAKGFINIGQLTNSRAGRYFLYYRQYGRQETETLYSLCKNLGLSKVGYAHDTLRFSEDEPEPNAPLEELILDDNSWNKQKGRLINETLTHLSESRRVLILENRKLLEKVLDYMYDSEEVEVCSPKQSLYQLVFRKPLQLGSLTATNVATLKMLNIKWDRLFCVAESGKWLLAPHIIGLLKKYTNRQLKVIVADGVHIENLREAYKGRIEVVRLPWWLHNQHMTLVVNQSEPQSGIYFERRQRSLLINPLWLEEETDLKIILETFLAYWKKADLFEKNMETVFIYPEHVKNARKSLLD